MGYIRTNYVGTMTIGDGSLRTAVLENKQRVISSGSVRSVMGVARSGLSKGQRSGPVLPRFLSDPRLKPFISEDLHRAMTTPIAYKYKGQQVEYGYEATSIVDACKVWIQARDEGVFNGDAKALQRVQNAERLIYTVAKVGIIALIDEATGYQASRDKTELQTLLSKYLSDYQLEWARMFPDDFYKEIFRLRGWTFDGGKQARPMLVGKITADIVYERLPNKVLEIIRNKNPVVDKENHRREAMHHQWLSKDVGQPHLRDRLGKLITLLKASTTWSGFMEMLDRVFPKHPSTEDI